MRRYRFRVFVLASGLVLACYGVRMDESQIRPLAARDLDCDPLLVKLESQSSPRKDVARYVARGCERTRSYRCVTDSLGEVHCEINGGPTAVESGDTVGDQLAVSAAGCACASLFGHRSNEPAEPPAESPPNPNATTPQRSK